MKIFTRFLVITILIAGFLPATYSQSWSYGAPLDTVAPASIFTRAECSVPRSYLLDSLQSPYPTTSWFKCLFLSRYEEATQNYPDSMAGWSPIFTYPYAVGLGTMPVPGYVNYKDAHNRFAAGYRPWATTVSTGGFPGANSVTYSAGFDWYFGVADPSGTPDNMDLKPFIKSYDDLSVTLRYRPATGGTGYMEAPLVKGMPYVTVKYSGMIPFFASQARTLAAYSTDGTNFITLPNPNPVTVTSNRLVLKLNGDGGAGKYIYWVLYLSDPVEVKIYFDYGNSHTGSPYQAAIFFSAPYNGYLRTAYLAAVNGTNPVYDDTQNMVAKLNVLNQYAKCYPMGGTFAATIDNNSDIAQVKFNWATNIPSSDSLLMFALPHHLDILAPGTKKDTELTQYQVIKGKLTGIIGKTWNMNEPLVKTGWQSPTHNLAGNTLKKYRDILYKTLVGDKDTIAGATARPAGYLNQTATSTYFGGKQLAKKGRLAVIADEMQQWYPAGPVAKSIRDSLKTEMNRWMDAQDQLLCPGWQPNFFRYDTVYGGMINSLDLGHVGADFGNSVYTDHHFHYGYFLYAAAALAKGDPAWGTAYRSKILLLARDIANPSSQDKYFVRQRNKDWYDGHCWAQGLADAAGVGNNQESTSESVNAWYGMYLLGIALGDKNLENTGLLYLSTEIQSAQKYWQIGPVSEYPHQYTDLYKVVGNMYETSINSLVAFGGVGDPRMVYGVQQIPTTPVNNDFLYEPWSDTLFNFYYKGSKMYNDPSVSVDSADLPWASVNLASIGISKPGHAYAYYTKYMRNYTYYGAPDDPRTLAIKNFDDGESKTNVLYNALVNAPSTVNRSKFMLDVSITVIAQDTLGNCQGEVLVDVLNGGQADPPFHYFWLFDGNEEEEYHNEAQINGLCAGRHLLEVIDGEFNIGYAAVTVENLLSVKENDREETLKVFPNPSSEGKFTVSWNTAGNGVEEMQVYSASGRNIFSVVPVSQEAGKQVINLAGNPSGIYYVTVKFGSGKEGHAKLVLLND
ncbi:MAG: T9SS type A sorting domain-containing protein [Bacteroidales bacterium]|nr:T9SS type A sorting domain-containing protein [Bacteroidales bacterium]